MKVEQAVLAPPGPASAAAFLDVPNRDAFQNIPADGVTRSATTS
jgi:hypothetical protein